MDMLVQQCIVSKQVTNSYFGWHTKLFLKKTPNNYWC